MALTDRMPRRSTRAAAITVAAVLAVLALSFVSLLRPLDRSAAVREVIIPEGTGASAIARILEREGIIRHWLGFSVLAAVTDRADSLQAGRYLLCPCDAVPDVLDAIASGDALSSDRVVTVPEGMNIWELDALFTQRGLAEPGQFLDAFGELEGRLFPDTYRIGEGDGFTAVVQRMRETYEQRVRQRYADEHVIIASMLEKEAKTAGDMALVAGIIAKRMDIGMPLQIDATVAYGWCLRTAGMRRPCDVTLAPIATEIGVDGFYNTYTRGGLPLGPISNPGTRALEAAANPQPSEYLYYLSTRDGSKIVYSRTLDEHLRNRQEHLGF